MIRQLLAVPVAQMHLRLMIAMAHMLSTHMCAGTKAALEEQLKLGQEWKARVDKPSTSTQAGSEAFSSVC